MAESLPPGWCRAATAISMARLLRWRHQRRRHGTVFKISATGALTTLYSFTGGKDGANPYAGLVQGSDGNFYGTTVRGGTNNNAGTVFKISATGALTTLYSFTGGKDGGSPQPGWCRAATAISMARLSVAASTAAMARSSKSAPLGR